MENRFPDDSATLFTEDEDEARTDAVAPADGEEDGPDPVMLSVVLAALRENPLTQGVQEDLLQDLAEEAIALRTMRDEGWLRRRIIETGGDPAAVEESSAPASAPAFEELPLTPKATITTREDLDPVLEAHSRWIATVLNPKAGAASGRANLLGADLSGFDLKGVDLRGANLQEACLRGADLRGANLNTADLRRADLQGADLRGARLRRAVLDHACMDDCDLEEADLSHASMKFTTNAG